MAYHGFLKMEYWSFEIPIPLTSAETLSAAQQTTASQMMVKLNQQQFAQKQTVKTFIMIEFIAGLHSF